MQLEAKVPLPVTTSWIRAQRRQHAPDQHENMTGCAPSCAAELPERVPRRALDDLGIPDETALSSLCRHQNTCLPAS